MRRWMYVWELAARVGRPGSEAEDTALDGSEERVAALVGVAAVISGEQEHAAVFWGVVMSSIASGQGQMRVLVAG